LLRIRLAEGKITIDEFRQIKRRFPASEKVPFLPKS